jgi:hypothetical protein
MLKVPVPVAPVMSSLDIGYKDKGGCPMRGKSGIVDDSRIKTRTIMYVKTYGTCMTKTLSKAKSDYGSKHGDEKAKVLM